MAAAIPHCFFSKLPLQAVVLRGLLAFCLLAVLAPGPMISVSSGQPDHDQASIIAPAGEPLERSVPCDEGVLCYAFLRPAHASAGRITPVAMALEPLEETLQRGMGGPAIDLPPPRPAA